MGERTAVRDGPRLREVMVSMVKACYPEDTGNLGTGSVSAVSMPAGTECTKQTEYDSFRAVVKQGGSKGAMEDSGTGGKASDSSKPGGSNDVLH